jgi:ABC-type Co2+ transport system permease subunit
VMDGLILLCWVIFFGSVMAAGLTLRHAFTLRRQRHERENPHVEVAAR